EETVNRAAALPAGAFAPIWLAGSGVDRLARVVMGTSVGVALSGGAARGLAHLGVLEALLEANVPTDMTAGTSRGAPYGPMLPVRPARAMGADFVIAVHVPAPGRVSDERKRAAGKKLDEQHNLISTIFRSYAFAGDVLAQQASLEADVCIRPDVALFGWRDYK